ncbi:hypothetical protein PWP93_11205 [Paraburkholderia sp. A1RI-2L]|uniref:hypothetical protein n=1 Tax=Paraburkholderia sp. A1RI-2L TaxID=3028367 RepID=UPI003B7A7CE8
MRYHDILTHAGLHEIADLEQQRIKAQKQSAKRQTAAAKRADLTHRIDKLKKQLSDLNAKPIRPASEKCRSNRRFPQAQDSGQRRYARGSRPDNRNDQTPFLADLISSRLI